MAKTRIVSSLHPQRSRNPHRSSRWIDAQVDVLDVLLHHLHGDFAELDRRDHQYSVCCLMMRNMRSTSAMSRKQFVQGRLDDLLAGLHAAPAIGPVLP